MTYLYVVSSSSPMGPRAWSFWVEMPISQPRPNSPPSVKRVEALTYTAALSTPLTKASAWEGSSVTMASLWPVEWAAMWAMASSTLSTSFTARI